MTKEALETPRPRFHVFVKTEARSARPESGEEEGGSAGIRVWCDAIPGLPPFPVGVSSQGTITIPAEAPPSRASRTYHPSPASGHPGRTPQPVLTLRIPARNDRAPKT